MKKKLLVYSDCILYGGSEKVLTNLFLYPPLFEQFEVKFAFRDHARYLRGFEALGLKVETLPLPIKSFEDRQYQIAGQNLSSWAKKLALVPSVLGQAIGVNEGPNRAVFLDLLRRETPDVLFINNGGYPGAASCLTAAIAAKAAGVPRVLMMVNNLATRPKGAGELRRDMALGDAVDHWVTASKAAGEKLIENRGIDPNRWIDIPNTLAEQSRLQVIKSGRLREEFGFDPKTLILGSAGHLTSRKGFHVLLEALALVKKEPLAVQPQAVIFGEGEERPRLEAMIKNLGLEGQVHLPGHRAGLENYLADLDLFVLPSVDFEDFPYVNLEAMLLGKPLLGTQVAGIPEQIVPGFNGLVVPPNSPQALAEALLKLFGDLKKLRGMGLAGKERYFAQYDYPKIMDRFLALFGGET